MQGCAAGRRGPAARSPRRACTATLLRCRVGAAPWLGGWPYLQEGDAPWFWGGAEPSCRAGPALSFWGAPSPAYAGSYKSSDNLAGAVPCRRPRPLLSMCYPRPLPFVICLPTHLPQLGWMMSWMPSPMAGRPRATRKRAPLPCCSSRCVPPVPEHGRRAAALSVVVTRGLIEELRTGGMLWWVACRLPRRLPWPVAAYRCTAVGGRDGRSCFVHSRAPSRRPCPFSLHPATCLCRANLQRTWLPVAAGSLPKRTCHP